MGKEKTAMKMTDDYIVKNQRRLIGIHSNLQRQIHELSQIGFGSPCDRISEAMDMVEELLHSVGVEVYAEDVDEKTQEEWNTLVEAYKAIGVDVDGEKRVYRKSLKKYFKDLEWKTYTINNFLSDYPSRPMARLLDAGYVKAHGNVYWSLHGELHKEDQKTR